MQAQPTDGLGRRLALHGAIDAMEVIRRQAGHVREAHQVERVIEVIREPPEHTFEPVRIIRVRRPFVHAPRS